MGKLWFGGNIYTLAQENDKVEAVFTEKGLIQAIGTKSKLEREFEELISEVIDLEGKTMLPGFVDSHIHLIGHGEALIRLDLSNCLSKEEVFQKVSAYSENLDEGEWLIGEGWNDNLWEDKQPISCREIDEVCPNHPVLLKRTCRHASVVNSIAMQLAKVTEETICPSGGVLEKDKEGRLTGVFKEQAQELITSFLPSATNAYLHRAMTAAVVDLHRMGVTGVHTEDLNYYGSYQNTMTTFKNVIGKEGMRLRAHLLVHHGVIEESVSDGHQYLSGDEWIEYGAMKIFADGSLGGRTALLSHPYHDDPTTNGVAIFSQEQLSALVAKARSYKLPVAIHAIGDLAFEYALNAIENHPLKGDGRDRLIHAQILRKELIERAKKLPLILDLQPGFLSSDFPWVIERVGLENMECNYAWKTLVDSGIPCAGGSDSPIEPANPLLGIHAAVTRTKWGEEEGAVYIPEEKLTVYEAVSLYTKGSAYAACHENDRGMIALGFLADFTVLEQDIFKVENSNIPGIATSMTIVGEEIVFHNAPTFSEASIK
ncbi:MULTISPECIES: amidohydrolase [unclassified Bacillus (in: firmicutes)]|uniref:amidohydrolase n=1 Tax=unclassified Bacillus (in: firmicutes) TaxID=185979 RepID=UPI0008EDF79C|nr:MULTISPECIES: amidohydrolase [unclassified Bacillus (in: firmicutes)]SFB17603.1 hypothetical protein SAMN02799634_107169 [Bacillus sp. UNCCL13]SFQ76839.1 hypothetical protein SAMN04488577_1473 [Bacillus sp. cl95]